MASEERNSDYIEKLVAVNRVAKVVKGGRQFGFTALTVEVMDMEEVDMATAKQKKCRQLYKKLWKKQKRVWCPYL